MKVSSAEADIAVLSEFREKTEPFINVDQLTHEKLGYVSLDDMLLKRSLKIKREYEEYIMGNLTQVKSNLEKVFCAQLDELARK